MLEILRRQLADILNRRSAAEARLDETVQAAEQRAANGEDGNLTAEERSVVDSVRSEVADLDEQRTAVDEQIAVWEERESAREAAEQRAADLPTRSDESHNGGRTTVRSEEPVYRRHGADSFLSDLYASHFGSGTARRDAEERIERSNNMQLDARFGNDTEARAIAASALAGAIPPVYLVDEFAQNARAGRPFLNSLNSMDLPPEGISFTVPRGTTGTTGAMTAEGAAFSDSDPANTDETRTVELVTAATDISRTIFMRGGPVVDQMLFPDLIAAAEVAQNASAITGNGTTPNHLGVLSVSGIEAVTYTDATPTVAEFWLKLGDAVQRINSNRFLPANVIYMHPRRWGWITSAVDSNNRPTFDFTRTVPDSIIGLGDAAEYGQVVGTLMGLPVVTDASIPTNLGTGTDEDIVIVARSTDLKLWEDPMMQFTLEQATSTAPGQVRLAVGRFSLFVAGRYPKAISTIGGTGLIAPTF